MKGGKTKRIAFVGLDGLSWYVVFRYYKKYNVFKNIIKLVSHGFSGINWCIPPYTPPSWVSIFTGVAPEKHKIFGFFKYLRTHNGTIVRSPVSRYDVRFPMLNEMLALNGLSGLVVNVFPSYPPHGGYVRNQLIVFDDTAPPFIYPEKYSNYLKYFLRPKLNVVRGNRSWLTYYKLFVERYIEGLYKLIDDFCTDFIMTVIKAPDTIMHYLPYVADGIPDERVAEIFDIIDNFVGNISKQYEYVVISSDHGFQVYLKGVNIYSILQKEGIIPPKLSLVKIPEFIIASRLYGVLTYNLLRPRFSYVRSLLIMLMRKLSASRSVLEEVASSNKVIDDIIDIIPGDVDPSAWIILSTRINKIALVYNALKKYVNKYFQRVRIIEINGIQFIYVIPKYEYVLHFEYSSIEQPVWNVAIAEHSPMGMYVVYGPGIFRRVIDIMNVDLTPTVLSLLNLPLAQYFDGSPIIKSTDIRNIDYITRWEVARKLQRIRRDNYFNI